MTLFQIRREIDGTTVDAVEERLFELGDAGWSVGQDVLAGRAWVLGVFEGRAEAEAAWGAVRNVFPDWPESVEVNELPDEDWRESYKAHFKAWSCGRLHWVPEWERGSYVLGSGDVAIWLDPGMAFGTGNHETTRLCCERLVRWAETASPGDRIVDAGCGSGILAISASRLGFTNVVGFDNDAEAVRVSRENALANEAGDTVGFSTADLPCGLEGERAKLVLANIQANVLQEFAEILLAAVAPGGELVLSGILAHEQARVRETFAALAPDWAADGRIMGEWSDLRFIRP